MGHTVDFRYENPQYTIYFKYGGISIYLNLISEVKEIDEKFSKYIDANSKNLNSKTLETLKNPYS